ncbi:hypothetical protein QOT17_017307 [Balamuthia mandrillaris]
MSDQNRVQRVKSLKERTAELVARTFDRSMADKLPAELLEQVQRRMTPDKQIAELGQVKRWEGDQLVELWNYDEEGRAHGDGFTFHRNGKRAMHVQYHHGKKQGAVSWWRSDGVLCLKDYYF